MPIQIIESRISDDGQSQVLICPDGHEAPFWIDLQQVAQFKGRIIYTEANPCPDTDGAFRTSPDTSQDFSKLVFDRAADSDQAAAG